MASISKTSSGTWKATIRKRGWPTAIKTFRTKRDAQDWARAVEDEMRRGVYIDRAPAERLTVSQALDRYLREVTPTKAVGTQKSERTSAEALRAHLGDYSLAALTPDLVAQFRDARLATESRYGKPISASRVRLDLALLSHLMNTAIREWGLGLAANPVAGVRKPKAHPGRNRRLHPGEEERLLAACERHSNPMLGWIVRLALETGMRRGELSSLERRQVDLERRILTLEKTKNGESRVVPLTQEAVRVLHAALAHPIRPLDTDQIFWGDGRDEGGRRKPYDFAVAWEQARAAAGLEDLRFHDLRHEATSRLVEMGLSDQEVSSITGHKSMQMLRRYTHLRGEDLVARLDAARS